MYTILCLIEGEENPFTVDIDGDRLVHHLKGLIKKEKPVALADVDSNNLNLYHVNLEFDESDKEEHITRANEVLQGLTKHKPLHPWRSLSEIEGGFPNGVLHILVQLPPSESIYSRACGALADMHPPNLNFIPCPPTSIIVNVCAFLHLSQLIGLKRKHTMEVIGDPRAINPNLMFSASRRESFDPYVNHIAADGNSPFNGVIRAIQAQLKAKRTIQATQRVWLSSQHLTLFSHSALRHISKIVSQAISVTTLRSLTATPNAPPTRSLNMLHSFFVRGGKQL